MNAIPADSGATETRLPEDFVFSQSNLQMYADCKRRFYLTHIERLPWPAIEAAPYTLYEEAIRQGELFHRLVQRGIIGLPVENAALEPPLDDWIAAWRTSGMQDVPSQHRLAERLFATALQPATGGHAFRIVAKYDLVAAESVGGRTHVVILDWKTSARRPDVESTRRRLQSILYPWVLVESAQQLGVGAFEPEDVEMRYWYAGAPDAPIRLYYNRAQHEANGMALAELLADLVGREGEDAFPQVADTPANRRRFCNFCVYRSRCQRGDEPGSILDYDEDADAEIGVVAEAAESYSLDTLTELEF